MSMTAANLSVSPSWTLQNSPAGGVFGIDQLGPTSIGFSLSGLALGTYNTLFAKEYTIAGSGGTQVIDFSSFTDLQNLATGFSGILTIVIMPIGNTGATCVFSPAASNTLTWFFGGTTPTITIPVGGVFAFSIPATGPAQAVSGGAGSMLLTNNGSANLVVNVVAFGAH